MVQVKERGGGGPGGEGGSRFISRTVKTENPLLRSFFAPKTNGNACYAGRLVFRLSLDAEHRMLYFHLRPKYFLPIPSHCINNNNYYIIYMVPILFSAKRFTMLQKGLDKE